MFIGNSIWHLKCEGTGSSVSQTLVTDSIIKPPKPPTVTSNGKLPVPGELKNYYPYHSWCSELHGFNVCAFQQLFVCMDFI